MNILLTGGAGYIGSHTAVVLSEAGYEVVLFDNFCNSRKSVLERLQKILGKALPCIEGDVRDTVMVNRILRDYKIDAVIHFAGLKAVGESVEKPIEYYSNNVEGTISLLEAMKSTNIKTLVFSSSATVYGVPEYLPFDEDHPTAPNNVYGRTKLHIEQFLKDVSGSDSQWKIHCLRYFNPVGAHESGLIGDEPSGIPNNLMPYITQVAAGRLSQLPIFGDDYPTSDGTGVRDYIHVMDLAQGHLASLLHLQKNSGFDVINLGTGVGRSVYQLIEAYQKATGIQIPYQVAARRPGDIAEYYAKVEKSKKILGWTAQKSLHAMCVSTEYFRKNFTNEVLT
jgi:UDP-glucose 4-epimerase